jgi:hypothetical protein
LPLRYSSKRPTHRARRPPGDDRLLSGQLRSKWIVHAGDPCAGGERFLGLDRQGKRRGVTADHVPHPPPGSAPHPIAGDPFTHPDWDGAEIEVCGVAAIRAQAGRWSYLLRFGVNDRQRRLGRNDLVLISQEAKDDAAIHVLESMNQCFLARRKGPGGWEPLSPQRHSVGEPTIVGHAVGVVWAAL